MKENLNKWLINVAVQLSRIKIIKQILSPIYWSFIKRNNKKRHQRFLKYGIQTLEEFDNILVKNNIHYAVFAGTLLGAIRENGFLKHDLDIDTFMFNSNYSNKTKELLEEGGFQLKHYFLVNDGLNGREETYEKNGVSIDIFYLYNDETLGMYLCDFHVEKGSINFEDSMDRFGHVCARRLELPLSNDTLRVPFENIMVNIPANAEECLQRRYGDDFMIPNPNYQDSMEHPYIKEWEEMRSCTKFFKLNS